MAAGSLKGFYIALGVVAVGGGALIASRAMGGGGRPALTMTGPVVPAAGPRGIVIGAESAPVEIVEHADFECGWCARFAVLTLPDLKTRLVESGRVRWRFVHHPLEMHRDAPVAHLAGACANEQGRFWPMHDAIYNDQTDWVGSRRPAGVLRGIAQRVALDMARYDACVSSRSAWPQVVADKRYGDSLGVNGTPTFYVNGRHLAGTPSADDWMRLIDSIAPPAAAPVAPQRQ